MTLLCGHRLISFSQATLQSLDKKQVRLDEKGFSLVLRHRCWILTAFTVPEPKSNQAVLIVIALIQVLAFHMGKNDILASLGLL